ncbi:MAG: metal ABC transporter permease, partial [Bacteroidales bacterium]|nr:metal ABC transporter permease [Bacteroidales bacterium]
MLQNIPPFLLNAIYAVLIVSVLSGIVGSYIVARRMVFLSGGITHASFGGLGIAWFLGINPFLGAAVFAVLSALGIEWMSEKGKVRSDTSIGILWSVGMAIGVLFIFLTPGYAPNLQSYLFGNVLIVTQNEIKIGGCVLAAIVLFFVIFYRAILFSAYDKEFSSLRGVPANLINTFAMIFVAISIVMAIKAVGFILVMALFTLPQAMSSIFSKRLSEMKLWSTLI